MVAWTKALVLSKMEVFATGIQLLKPVLFSFTFVPWLSNRPPFVLAIPLAS